MRRSLRRVVITGTLLAFAGGAFGLSGCAGGKASIPTAEQAADLERYLKAASRHGK